MPLINSSDSFVNLPENKECLITYDKHYEFVHDILSNNEEWMEDPDMLDRVFSELREINADSLELINAVTDIYNQILQTAQDYDISIPQEGIHAMFAFAKANHLESLLFNSIEEALLSTCNLPASENPTECTEFQNIINGMKKSCLQLLRTENGDVQIHAPRGLNQENVDCLKKLNQLFPIYSLNISQNIDINSLLDLLAEVNITTLVISSDIDDDDLSRLSEKLSNVTSFSIRSGAITKIPEKIAEQPLDLLDCGGCNKLASFTTNAKFLGCIGCTNLKSFCADQAETVECGSCTNLDTFSAKKTVNIASSWCTKLVSFSADNVENVDLNNCHNLLSVRANNAKKINCDMCVRLESAEADCAEEVNFNMCQNLQSLTVNNAKNVICSLCDNLKTLSAIKATHIDCNGCLSLFSMRADKAQYIKADDTPRLEVVFLNTWKPKIIGVNSEVCFQWSDRVSSRQMMKHAESKRDAAAYEKHFQDIAGQKFNDPTEQENFLLEGEFKLKLLKGESVGNFIDALKEKLMDPASVEKVPGEISDFSRWANDLGHTELAQWLFNLKEEVRTTIEVIHGQETTRLILNDQYEQSREAQNESLQVGQPKVNLSLFLDNPALNKELRDIYFNIAPPDVAQLKKNLGRTLKIMLPLLYPRKQLNSYRQNILTFPGRIVQTGDYKIDPETFGKRMGLIINSICSYKSAKDIAVNAPYLRQLLDILNEGAEECPNRAAEALQRVEGVYFQEKYKNNKEILYGIQLMQWKRAFVEEYVHVKTMQKIFGEDEGSAYDVEVILANCKFFDPFLSLNEGILDIKYLDHIKSELKRQGKSDEVIANPEELFEKILEEATPERLLVQFSESPFIQMQFGIDPTIMQSPKDVGIKIGKLVDSYAESLDDESKQDALEGLWNILDRFKDAKVEVFKSIQDVPNFEALREFLIQHISELDPISGDNYDEDQVIAKAGVLADLVSYLQDAHQRSILEDESEGSFKDRLKQDLIATGYFVLPKKVGGQLTLDYPTPRNVLVNPHEVIEATLKLNVLDIPPEL